MIFLHYLKFSIVTILQTVLNFLIIIAMKIYGLKQNLFDDFNQIKTVVSVYEE
jgi:hypothetical protein